MRDIFFYFVQWLMHMFIKRKVLWAYFWLGLYFAQKNLLCFRWRLALRILMSYDFVNSTLIRSGSSKFRPIVTWTLIPWSNFIRHMCWLILLVLKRKHSPYSLSERSYIVVSCKNNVSFFRCRYLRYRI